MPKAEIFTRYSDYSVAFFFNPFYRAHLLWNKLPLVLRETIRPSKFKSDLVNHLWNHDIKSNYDNCIADIIEDPRNYNSDYG